MKSALNKLNTPEAIAARKYARQLAFYNDYNRFQSRTYCVTDRASSALMACHNFGAGGFSIFCSTNENIISVKRKAQRNTRRLRANGTQV